MILIATTKLSDRAILIGKLWKKNGFKVGLIYCQIGPVFTNLSDFDFVIQCKNEEEIAAIALKFEKKLLHYLTYGPDLLGVHLINSSQKFIFDYKDMWGGVRIPELPAANLILERALVDSAIAITYRDHQLFNYCNINKIQIESKKIFYLPEMFESTFEYDQKLARAVEERQEADFPIRIIATGGAQDFDDLGMMADDGIFHVINGLAKQGLAIDVIGGFSNINDLNHKYQSSNAAQALQKTSGVRVLQAVNSEKFDNILLDYDYALLAHNNDFFECNGFIGHSNKHMDYCGSAKVASYVKAGLPIIMGKNLKCNLQRLEGTSIPVIFSREKFNQISKVTESLKLMGYRRSVLQDRKKFEIESLVISYGIFAEQIVRA